MNTLTETPFYERSGICCEIPPGYSQWPPRCRKMVGHIGPHEALEDMQGTHRVWWSDVPD